MSQRPRLATAIRLTVAAFRKHEATRFGAAVAFYIVFCIAPVVLIAIAVAGNVFGREHAEDEILGRIGISIGSAGGIAITEMIRHAAPLRAGWLATTLGMMSLYFGLSGVYREIAGALRTIWRDEAHGADAAPGLRKKIWSLVLVAVVGAVVLLSAIADTAIAIAGRYAAARLAGGEALWQAAQLLLSTLVLTALFAAVFRHLPQAHVTWRDVRLGAAATAILFVIGKFALGLFLGKAAVGSAFGAAGSIVVVLLWSYWSAQIFFLGLEFTHVYSQEREGA